MNTAIIGCGLIANIHNLQISKYNVSRYINRLKKAYKIILKLNLKLHL